MPKLFSKNRNELPDPDDGYNTYYSTASSVTGARVTGNQWVSGSTETFRISARPSVTYIHPERGGVWADLDIAARAKVGFSNRFYLAGYNFHHHDNLSVYISAAPGVYTNTLSAVTAFDLFKDTPSLSALYPAFSGFKVNDFDIVNQHTLTLIFSAAQGAGYADIILANRAGYTTLYETLCSRLVRIDA